MLVLQYMFPIEARFEGGIRETLGKAFRLAVGAFPRSILMLLVQFLPWIGFWLFHAYFLPFYILIGISGPAYLVARLYRPLFISDEEHVVS